MQTLQVHGYPVVLREEPEGGFTALVPALQRCVTYGATREQAIHSADEAVDLYLESLSAHDEAIPQAGSASAGLPSASDSLTDR